MKNTIILLLLLVALGGCETTGTHHYVQTDYWYDYNVYYNTYHFGPPYTGKPYKQHRGDRDIRPPYTGKPHTQ